MPRPLRIVSYNVRYFGHALRGLASTRGSKRGIAQRLSALAPAADVICLQEVETRSLRSSVAHRLQGNERTQLESFMAELETAYSAAGAVSPYEALYFRAHAYRFRTVPIYTTGLAVLVNRETLALSEHNVESPEHITHHHLIRMKDRKQSRICAHVKLEQRETGRAFHLFNTHLSLPTPFTKAFWTEKEKMGWGVNQLAEARTLIAFIHRRSNGEPFLVCGDFNSRPSSPVYGYLTREVGLLGAQEALGQIEPSGTKRFPTAGFMRLRMHLDHLFASGPVKWLDLDGTWPFGDTNGGFHGLSDHVPLIARFELGG